jgi:phospholipid/cholesterol/gamma-HCH transport system substrate-binding protein
VNRRLWINAAAFLTLFAVLSVWAVRNVLHLDVIDRPRTIAADFQTSPGLRPGYEVTYFGVHAGQLGRVAIVGDHVNAQLKIDRNLELPATLDAAVRRKSAVGEPYVDLTPSGGVDRGGPRLRAGTVIPIKRTTTPLAYAEVFHAVDNLVTAIPADDLQRFLHALAAGFEGRAGDIRSAITSADKLTGDLVANAPLLDALAGDLTTLTHTITEHRDALGAGFDNLALLSQTLAEHRADIDHLLDRGPTLTDQVNSLLASSGPDIGCIVDAAGSLFSSIDDPVKIDQFDTLLRLAGPAADIVHQIAYQGPDGLYLNGVLTFDVGIAPVDYYDPPHVLPATPALRSCAAPRAAGVVGAPGAASLGNPPPASPTARPATTPGRVAPTSTVPASSRQHIGNGFGMVDLFRWLLAAAVLAAFTAAARRRWPGAAAVTDPRAEETTTT